MFYHTGKCECIARAFYCVIKQWPVLFNYFKARPQIINIEDLLRNNRIAPQSALNSNEGTLGEKSELGISQSVLCRTPTLFTTSVKV